MPIFLIIAGLLAVTVAVRGTEHDLASQIAADFSGSGSYAYWVLAILIIGAIGYLPGLEDVSTMFLFLCIISFTLSNAGVFKQLQSATASI